MSENDIVFFDVKTPNRNNDSICAIGAYRVAPDGELLSRTYQPVDPEANFTFDNIAVHGIEPSDVSGHPNFAELWDAELREVFADARLVAHGAHFDLIVLAKCLKRYRRSLPPAMAADTREIAHRAYPGLSNYKLETVADRLGFSSAWHHAGNDAEACMRVYNAAVREYGSEIASWKRFDFAAAAKAEEVRHYIAGAGRESMIDKLPAIVERNASGVDLDGAIVCLTGDFEMSPDDIEPVIAYVERRGAVHSRHMTLSVDYLVVGSLGSRRWKHGNYGNKIAKAMEWIADQKSDVRIVDEASITAGDFVF